MMKYTFLILILFLLFACGDTSLHDHLEAERAFAQDYYGEYDADYVADCLAYEELYCPEFE